MLLNWCRNRFQGPSFLPSGKRLGPYFVSRCEASPVSRPVAGLVWSRSTTSSTATACQATASVPALALTADSICMYACSGQTNSCCFPHPGQEPKSSRPSELPLHGILVSLALRSLTGPQFSRSPLIFFRDDVMRIVRLLVPLRFLSGREFHLCVIALLVRN